MTEKTFEEFRRRLAVYRRKIEEVETKSTERERHLGVNPDSIMDDLGSADTWWYIPLKKMSVLNGQGKRNIVALPDRKILFFHPDNLPFFLKVYSGVGVSLIEHSSKKIYIAYDT
jgi:hypothetical protein